MHHRFKDRTRGQIAVLWLLTVALAIAAVLTVVDTSQPPAPQTSRAAPATVTVPVDGLDAGKAPDRTITAPKAAVTAAARGVHDDLADETPGGASAEQLRGAARAAEKNRAATTALPTAGATAGFPGCRTAFVGNQSSRRGIRPTQQTMHYTVSGNRPGWSDVNAIVALFNNPNFRASSHFVIDAEGHCAYIVPIEASAWTQAAGNPHSISYEIIATGRETRYLEPAGLARLRQVTREVSRRTGIPMRRGLVRDCRPVRSGFVEHRDWGTCGGGHVDITPFRIDQVVAELVPAPTTSVDRVTCRKLNWWRQSGRPHGLPERRAIRRRDALRSRRVTCTASGPVRT